MQAMRSANLALRFLLELCALAALAYWGAHSGGTWATQIALGACAPLLMAIVWGMFVAPRARIRLPVPVTFILGLTILGLAALALAVAGQPGIAAVFAVVIAINAALLAPWQQ